MQRPTQRLALVDAARGAAIVAMAVYHFAWDLSYYGLFATDVTTDPAWKLFQLGILSSFLLLVGIGLVLGHGEGVRWPAFRRRLGVLVAAALAVTAGTYWMFPDYFVYFGILHAIALFSLLALPFLRLHPALVLAAALAFIVPPLLFGAPEFAQRHLAWIGFWTTLPDTTDIVPVFPWFGAVLAGLALARLAAPLRDRLAAVTVRGPLGRALVLAGRWSLLIYLLHQPLLLGGVWAYTQLSPPALQPEVLQPAVLSREEGFTQSCAATCEAGQSAAFCAAYCGCALEQVAEADLWDTLDRAGPERDGALAPITRLCAAMAE